MTRINIQLYYIDPHTAHQEPGLCAQRVSGHNPGLWVCACLFCIMSLPSPFPWMELPADMQGEIRGHCDILQRLLLGLTCRREVAMIPNGESAWLALGFYDDESPDIIVCIALNAASCAVQQGFLSLLSCLRALDEYKL